MAVGPAEPRLSANVWETADDTPVFWSAVDRGIIAAMSTMLSQLMVLYAASTLRKHPVKMVSSAAMITAVTGATGTKSNTIMAIISSIIAAATGAL